jgi:hypothetical protein
MDKNKTSKKSDDLPGYPVYAPSEDIYSREKKEPNLNPDDNSVITEANTKEGQWNEKDYDDTLIGDDLDVPGAELDDKEEEIGKEDEENNYYSLGGDDHSDLDETNE